MSLQEVLVPDIGNFESVDVIEILVKAGDVIAKDDSLMTVESDKASMDIPAPFGGTVKEVKTRVGDKIAQGHLILTLEAIEAAISSTTASPAANIHAVSGHAPIMTEKSLQQKRQKLIQLFQRLAALHQRPCKKFNPHINRCQWQKV